MVLPAFGGEIINPLCPFPIGAAISTNLPDISSLLPFPTSSLSLLFACKGVKFSKRILCLAFSVESKLTLSTLSRAKYLSPSFGGLILPSTVSPVLRENF